MPVSECLQREMQRWRYQNGESDQGWEVRVYSAAKAAALQLLCTSKALGWGSGNPFTDASYLLEETASKHAAAFGYKQPVPPRARVKRKKIPPGVTRAVWDRDGWECRECGAHRDLTVDHIHPLVLGGTDDMDNLQTLCKSCNSRKEARV